LQRVLPNGKKQMMQMRKKYDKRKTAAFARLKQKQMSALWEARKNGAIQQKTA